MHSPNKGVMNKTKSRNKISEKPSKMVKINFTFAFDHNVLIRHVHNYDVIKGGTKRKLNVLNRRGNYNL